MQWYEVVQYVLSVVDCMRNANKPKVPYSSCSESDLESVFGTT